jgi:hypothetical protein
MHDHPRGKSHPEMITSEERTVPPVSEGGEQTVTSEVEIGQARKRAAFSVALNLTLALGKGIAGVL